MQHNRLWLVALLSLTVAVQGWAAKPSAARKNVEQTLDRFHEAAAKADGKTYFDLFAPEGVFIGTDATERWTLEEFKKFAEPFFSKGRGWKYVPKLRHVDFTPNEEVAWFDEILESAPYGTCRGTGALRKIAGAWKVTQYHLTIPLPNHLADKVVKLIREEPLNPVPPK